MEPKKADILNELDKTIISICKSIQRAGGRLDAGLVQALADLVEVRTCMPDWKKDGQG